MRQRSGIKARLVKQHHGVGEGAAQQHVLPVVAVQLRLLRGNVGVDGVYGGVDGVYVGVDGVYGCVEGV